MPTPSLPSTQPVAQAALEQIFDQRYEHEETRDLVALVDDASELVRTRGEAAFRDFSVSGSRWRQAETYIFVLDPEGNMLVHADPALEGKNQLDLMDPNGKPIIRGLLGAATMVSGKPGGWYHYQWPVPDGLFPRWKSSYVRLVQAPSGKRYIVGSGMYNDRMERAFVIDAVTSAVALIEKRGRASLAALRDPTGPFIAKDAYIFVIDLDGIELLNPAFRYLEGRNLWDMTDTQGDHPVRDMIEVARTRGSGWVDYMWPKPGDSISTMKSTYVSRASLAGMPVLVGCGVYLAEAPVEARPAPKFTAAELMALVRDGAELLAQQGEKAYEEFRERGSTWFHDTTYFFVVTMDGNMVFHAAEPAREIHHDRELDVLGRPITEMILDAGASAAGEGWVHYMYPEPGKVFPVWKSTFVKRVTLPRGEQRLLCCGIYNMQMDKAFIEDVVDHAARLIAERGKDAFAQLRDKTGPFVFMDTYVFVESPDGTELVNPAQPSFEGRNLMSMRDLRGKHVVMEEIAAAMKGGSAWLDLYWFKPGANTPARKQTYVRKVQANGDTFIVGSGIYVA